MTRFEGCILCVWLTWSPFPRGSPHSAAPCTGSWKGDAAMLVLWPFLGHAHTLSPTSSSSPAGWAWATSWAGTQPRQPTPREQKDIPDIPYHMAPAQQ